MELEVQIKTVYGRDIIVKRITCKSILGKWKLRRIDSNISK